MDEDFKSVGQGVFQDVYTEFYEKKQQDCESILSGLRTERPARLATENRRFEAALEGAAL